MNENKQTKFEMSDLFGIARYAPTVNKATDSALNGLAVFLNAICRPLLEELGAMAGDRIRYWRLKNVCSMIEKAKDKLEYRDGEIQLINTRVAFSIAENASIIDDDELLEMWAGLFSSSASEKGLDDTNLIYSDLLKRLTKRQAKILKFACQNSVKVKFGNLLYGCKFEVKTTDPFFETDNIDLIDLDLDYLKSLGLIYDGIDGDNQESVDLCVTTLALRLYAKCQGHKGALLEFYPESITEQEYQNRPELKVDSLLVV